MHWLRDAEKNHRESWVRDDGIKELYTASQSEGRARVALYPYRVPSRFFGTRDLPYINAGFGIESMHRMRDTENNHRDDLIEEPYWGPLRMWVKTFWSTDLSDIALEAVNGQFT